MVTLQREMNESIEEMEIKRGDILLMNLNGAVGSEQAGVRPVLVVQNDMGNRFSPCLIVLPITTKKFKRAMPTHVQILAGDSELKEDSVVLAEQVKTLDKKRVIQKIGTASEKTMKLVDRATLISQGLAHLVEYI